MNQNSFTVAFYEIKNNHSHLRSLIDHIVATMQQISLVPQCISFGPLEKSGTILTYKHGRKRFDSTNIENVSSVVVASTNPNNNTLYDGGFAFNCIFRKHWCTFAICDTPNIDILEVANNIAVAIVDALSPSYGIGYYRPVHLGPEYYAIGIIQGLSYSPQDEIQKEKIARWSNSAWPERAYLAGQLRDVYPWNFLNNWQLDEDIDGIPLREWIIRDIANGTLENLSHGLQRWAVPLDQILRIRDFLHHQGLISCY